MQAVFVQFPLKDCIVVRAGSGVGDTGVGDAEVGVVSIDLFRLHGVDVDIVHHHAIAIMDVVVIFQIGVGT